MMLRTLALSLVFAVSVQAQTPPAQSTPPPPADALPDAPSTTSSIKPPVVPTGPTAVIDTTMGRLTCKLYDKQAPITVANFIGLADGSKDWTDPKTLQKMHHQPFYNGTTFHRVIPNFMIQGGDPEGTGMGGPGYKFADETKGSPHGFQKPGKLAMANAGPNTNGSQFFITVTDTSWLTGKHTIFGEVVEGYDIVEKISKVPTAAQDKPKTPVVLESVTIDRVA